MNATEAIVWCLGYRNPTPEDGEHHSQPVHDVNGSLHWVAWRGGVPTLAAEAMKPFAEGLEPYQAGGRPPPVSLDGADDAA